MSFGKTARDESLKMLKNEIQKADYSTLRGITVYFKA